MNTNTVIRSTKLVNLNGRLVYIHEGMAFEVTYRRGRYYTTGSYTYL